MKRISDELANNLIGHTLYCTTTAGGSLVIETLTPIYRLPSLDNRYTRYLIKETDNKGYYSGQGIMSTKYINDGVYFTPQEALKSWMEWFNYAQSQGNDSHYLEHYDKALELRKQYPEVFI